MHPFSNPLETSENPMYWKQTIDLNRVNSGSPWSIVVTDNVLANEIAY